MSHYFYITPVEYAEAEMNGVDPHNLERRIRLLGWEKQKAISTPLGKITDRKAWTKIAAENGIKYQTFMSRINIYGMSVEEAATKPLQNRKLAAERASESNRVIPKDWLKIAIDNGINYHTFRDRLKKGMSPEEAATKKVMTRSECGRKGAESYHKQYGRFHELVFKKA
ncbi:hypothetical protein ACFSO7_02835 [Bacillus sp. CGMCC 1.16607]|uniref:hypothetical protein n=1 Tax=Bacillus sp. CGMCC 1.16607 TaxID=3351842 RepID=UPI00364372C2